MLTITKEFVFHAAHRLCRHGLTPEKNREIFGKCAKLHGHTYRLQVSVTGKLNANGMIIDFSDLKRIVRDEIVNRYEHEYLNELEEFRNIPPTVENMINHMFGVLDRRLNQMDLNTVSMTLYETPTSWATISRED